MTRISIKSIKLYNFKSFKGEHEIKGLEPHFNTIIGPNGSGKSNIIDSILFVLGYKAKRMRHKVNTDLIYKGDIKETECYVEITFVKNIEYYKIKRRLTQNKNTYYFNDKEVTQKAITDFMEKEGVDIENNRFLIMQGEIESISLMKPKNNGMLEYLEDCIGTTKYIEEINNLSTEYENKFQSFDEHVNVYKFYEKEFLYITEKKENNEKVLTEHIKRIKLQNTINSMKSKRARYLDKKYSSEYQKLNKTLKDLLVKNKENKSKMSELDESLVSKKKEINKKEKEFYEAKNKFFDVEKQQILNDNKKDRIKKAIEKLKSEFEESKRKIEMSKKENETYKKENETLNNQKMIFEKEIQNIKNEITKFGNNKEEAKIKDEIAQHEQKIIDLLQVKDEFNDKVYKNKKMIEIKNEINDFFEFAKENKIEEIQSKKSEYLQQIQTLEIQLNKNRNDLYFLETKQREYEKEENGRNKQAKVVNVLKNISGFVGRLGDLGFTDKKYDIAVSTAGKGNLNNMVVEDTETAEKCIEVLKSNNLERVSFVVVNKIKECNLKDFTKNDYLINHIECDEKYKKLFFFAISDTIVCKNIEEAKTIGFGSIRQKVVTLDGKMIEKSGLMSGGGYFSGSMKIVKKEAENNKKEITKKLNVIGKIEEQIKENRELVIRQQIKMNEMEEKINKVANVICCENIHKADNKTEVLMKSCRKRLKKIEEEKEDNNLENKLKDIKEEVCKMQKIIAKKQAILESIENIEVKRLRGELGILYEKYEINDKRIEENKKKIQKTETNNLDKNEEEIAKLNKEYEQIEEVCAYEEKRERKEKCEKELKYMLDELKEISRQIKIIKNSLGKDFDEEVDVLNKINEKKEMLEKNKREKKECDKIKYKLKDEYNKYKNYERNADYELVEFNDEIDKENSTEAHIKAKINDAELDELNDESDKENSTEAYIKANKKDDNEVDELNNESDKENSTEAYIKAKKNDDNEVDELNHNTFCIKTYNENIQKKENELKRIKCDGEVDFGIFEEYKIKKEEFDKNKNEYKNNKAILEKYKNKLCETKKRRKDEFMKGLEHINTSLKEIYQIITFGGNAELELVDFHDPFSEGVYLSVMPPKKSWKNVNTLSGGEKTLSSLALVFALHVYKPSPFYIMDEIDAALDFRNVSIISNYVYEKTKNAQFLIISLRNDMFEKANVLVGVFKNDNLSKTVVFNVKEIEQM